MAKFKTETETGKKIKTPPHQYTYYINLFGIIIIIIVVVWLIPGLIAASCFNYNSLSVALFFQILFSETWGLPWLGTPLFLSRPLGIFLSDYCHLLSLLPLWSYVVTPSFSLRFGELLLQLVYYKYGLIVVCTWFHNTFSSSFWCHTGCTWDFSLLRLFIYFHPTSKMPTVLM